MIQSTDSTHRTAEVTRKLDPQLILDKTDGTQVLARTAIIRFTRDESGEWVQGSVKVSAAQRKTNSSQWRSAYYYMEDIKVGDELQRVIDEAKTQLD